MDHNLQEVLMPIAVLGTFGLFVTVFTKTLTDYFLRKKMVEKGLIGDDASQLLHQQNENKFAALKWGLIILFGGLGLILIELISLDVNSTLPYGLFAMSLSAGFLVYFYIVQKMNKD